ncbi:MAG: YtxH domain-containing protein [Rikenellaceae bacterium]|nr:YtxH domain-containing protein [Rikenellaceae bacterium]MBQ3259747.1 YtxH domain-containing protein [Alistipes sp.]MBQ7342220.1 YtxH domain-containing protein [Alistipes sp.]
MKNSGICIASVLGGALVGAVLTMFLTPKSGSEMRETLRDAIDKEVDKVRCHCHD